MIVILDLVLKLLKFKINDIMNTRYDVFEELKNVKFMKSYVTIEIRGCKFIQVLIRNGKITYRLIEGSKVLHKETKEWKGTDNTRNTFSCKSYCSDCDCNKWERY